MMGKENHHIPLIKSYRDALQTQSNKEESTGESLSSLILKGLEELNIPLEDCRGQSYDNSTNMKRNNKVRTSARPAAPTTAKNSYLTRLRSSLRELMSQHPEGVPLSRMSQACPLLLYPEVLEPYPSTRYLLASLTDVVSLQGIGVQTLVLPALVHGGGGKDTGRVGCL